MTSFRVHWGRGVRSESPRFWRKYVLYGCSLILNRSIFFKISSWGVTKNLLYVIHLDSQHPKSGCTTASPKDDLSIGGGDLNSRFKYWAWIQFGHRLRCVLLKVMQNAYFLCHGGSLRGGSYQINSLMYQLSNYFSLTSWLLRMWARGVPLKEPIFIIVSWLLDALIPLDEYVI